MSRRDDILSEIEHLKEKIEEYEGYIAELEGEYDAIKQRYDHIRTEADEPVKAYDMTWADRWRGELEDEAKTLQDKIISTTGVSQNETLRLLDDIQRIIRRLKELIEECLRKISELEAELESLSEEDDGYGEYTG